ncbi:RCC1 domain-containing protein [Lysinibacter cavernae]|uniref:Alpha-tubulin suppressor-like RCC1 family protein n=1 Tax=Lysinibacter cavernae TaxID=1640652 RepID=A0A7X5R0W6_9MICO|nr:RCC1 domain-containing protein [Lysinibacter cavernae]NIH53654.1 alpha-tubulin suppressor-like RCC1 family protein [Lysinibacter cavernae]
MIRKPVGVALSSLLAGAMLILAGGPALAAPMPDSGPVTGGTAVELTAPAMDVTFTQVSAGNGFSVALGSDGNAYAWGANDYGTLGDGTTTPQSIPVQVHAPQGVTFTSVSAGYLYALALGSDGSIYTWGRNNFGQLGDGSTTDSLVPVKVQGPAGVTFSQLSAGDMQALAIGSDGNTYAWGANGNGQLGDGTTTPRSTPTPVILPSGVSFTTVAAGDGLSMALGSNGLTYAWGRNSQGELGNGTNVDSSLPVRVLTPVGVTFSSISVGNLFAVAIGSDGKLYSWGDNSSGRLGDGTETDRSTPGPVSVPAGLTFRTVSAGVWHTLAIATDGSTFGWGRNFHGYIGDGTIDDRFTPVRVTDPAMTTFAQVVAGDNHSLALGLDGQTYSWGANSFGELGDGTVSPRRAAGLALPPETVVTAVTFDGLPGASLIETSPGIWQVSTPAHAAGPVDVVLEWTFGGVAQTPIIYTSGFVYTDLPVNPPIIDPPATPGTPATPGDPTTPGSAPASGGSTGADAAPAVSATSAEQLATTGEPWPTGLLVLSVGLVALGMVLSLRRAATVRRR